MKDLNYGLWICPECGDACCDESDDISSTVCHNQHEVYLGEIKDDGTRDAILRN
jgi:hypothetical protein